MNRLSENYYHRKCYFERDQVPTQSVMMKTMSPALAKVYFKSMTPKLKKIAGIEPPLKGGGNDWYAPPDDLLKGRTVLRPIKKEFLSKLGHNGLAYFGNSILEYHSKNQEQEIHYALFENDINWKLNVEDCCRRQHTELSKKAALKNSTKIKAALNEFVPLYTTSLNRIERILLDGAIEEINRVKGEVHSKMTNIYRKLLKQQATMLYDRYTEKLHKKKEELKEQFIHHLEQTRTELSKKIHDINLEKHIAIEKIRTYLECQNLACQIYVAIKEKEECGKSLYQAKNDHKKIVQLLEQEIARNEAEIEVAKKKEKMREIFNKIWEKKVCLVIKQFQEFISYILQAVPEQAEFFLNVEKLMLLQLSAAIENPSAESLFEQENDGFHTPEPEVRPFYLFCDDGIKPHIDKEMCPKPSGSSVSHLPVIVVNKRCIYAGCNNLEEYADKVEHYVKVERAKEHDLKDHHDYIYDVPIKYTESQQRLDLKEQGSLMQILQKDMPNTKQVPIASLCTCKIPFCPKKHTQAPSLVLDEQEVEEALVSDTLDAEELSQEKQLMHTREPKWESFFKFMEPRSCECVRIAKKSLQDHLPPYMRNMSRFEYPDLPHYEKCSVTTLKKLVKKARARIEPIQKPLLCKTVDIGTQYSDQKFEYLCACFDDQQATIILNKLLEDIDMLLKTEKESYVGKLVSQDYLHQNAESFVKDRAMSLRNLLEKSPELIELFNKENCSSYT